MSPTVLRIGGFRFFFFSREEPRPYVHVQHAEGEAKFWMAPTIALAVNFGLLPDRLSEATKLVEEPADDLRGAWTRHFGG